METELNAIVLLILIVAAYCDWRERKIPVAVFRIGVVCILFLKLLGEQEISKFILKLLIGELMFFPVFMTKKIGAADIKYMVLIFGHYGIRCAAWVCGGLMLVIGWGILKKERELPVVSAIFIGVLPWLVSEIGVCSV